MEKFSAWMDGELDDHDALQQLARLKSDEELIRQWRAYHVIGDALRGEPILTSSFEGRLAARLANEPTVLAPRFSAPRRVRTYALSAAASLAAVALVGWMAFSRNPLTPQSELAGTPNALPTVAVPVAAPQFAGVPNALPSVAVPAAAPQLANVPSDGKMNEYLIAHQEFSPSTAIQGLAPYIRGVSTTRPGTGRE